MKAVQSLNDYRTPKEFRGKSKYYTQLWWLVQGTLFALSPQFLYGWRRFLLRSFGAKIGKEVLIRPTAKVTYPWKVSIGDYSWIGDEVVLYSLGEIHIGTNSVVSQRSYLCTGSHDYDSPSFPIYQKPIHVEDQCWLATDVFVYPGVHVKTGSVVGARSTLTQDTEPYGIYVGAPAKKIKKRKSE